MPQLVGRRASASCTTTLSLLKSVKELSTFAPQALHPDKQPGASPESECKGSTFSPTDQMFRKKNARKSEKRREWLSKVKPGTRQRGEETVVPRVTASDAGEAATHYNIYAHARRRSGSAYREDATGNQYDIANRVNQEHFHIHFYNTKRNACAIGIFVVT